MFKRLFIFFFLFLSLQLIGQDNFVSTWAIPSSNYDFELPLKDYTNISIDWGDGGFPTDHTDGTAFPTHRYAFSGTYTITVSLNDPSTLNIGEMWMNGTHASTTLIRTITNWGEGKWENFNGGTDWNGGAFKGAINLTIPATDEPDLSLTTSMKGAFDGCTSLVGTTLNDWKTNAGNRLLVQS